MSMEEFMKHYLTNGMFDIVKNTCIDRQKKKNLPQCCKGCPYKYKGANELMCCMFADLPYTWKE